MNSSEVFFEKYYTHVQRVVGRFIQKFPNAAELEGDMLNEASVKLLQIGERFFHDDANQEKYVRNYVRKAAQSACFDVVRRDRAAVSGAARSDPPKRICRTLEFQPFLPNSVKTQPGARHLRVYYDQRPNEYAHNQARVGQRRAEVLDVDPECLSEMSQSLLEKIQDGRVIDWREFFDDEEAKILHEYCETYQPPTDVSKRRRLKSRAIQILQKHFNDH